MCLFFGSAIDIWKGLIVILQVAFGLGMVIFVHELGHFLVAKFCGVKCEKFYVGFDPAIKIGPISLPRSLFKFRSGETEYGLGIIPLGGYVKMLGQDDNPANYQKESERIRVEGNSDIVPDEDSVAETNSKNKSEEKVEIELDPRSYPAKSVPRRMAIISAGVIMNIFFAAIFAIIAYRAGVKYTPCVVGATVPGHPAWKAGLQPGDHIIQIGRNGEPNPQLRFDNDLRRNVLFSNSDSYIDFLVQRDMTVTWFELRPTASTDQGEKRLQIGVSPAMSNVFLTQLQRNGQKELKNAEEKDDQLQRGDVVIAVNDKPIENGLQLQFELANRADQEIQLTVERQNNHETKQLDIIIEKRPLRQLGLVMQMASVTDVRDGSVAAEAGIKTGDRIIAYNGLPAGDPMTLPERMRQLVGQSVEIELLRDDESLTVQLTPQSPNTLVYSLDPGCPVPMKSLGLIYTVTNTVQEVVPGSPAEEVGLQPGDEIVAAEFIPTEDQEREEEKRIGGLEPIEISSDTKNWPHLFYRLQEVLPNTKIKLTYHRPDNTEQTVVLKAVESDEWFLARRGLIFEYNSDVLRIKSWNWAFQYGLQQTWNDLCFVLVILKKVATGGISPTSFGGPGMIVAAAGTEATQGLGRFLLFLTLLSANLAVINFLPIPVLDGGHMVFLAAEGIRGKPVDERLQFQLTIVGLVFILGLMVFVIGLDISRFANWFL